MAKSIMVMDNGLQVCVIITELIMSFGSYGTGKSYIYKTNDIEHGTWTKPN